MVKAVHPCFVENFLMDMDFHILGTVRFLTNFKGGDDELADLAYKPAPDGPGIIHFSALGGELKKDPAAFQKKNGTKLAKALTKSSLDCNCKVQKCFKNIC